MLWSVLAMLGFDLGQHGDIDPANGEDREIYRLREPLPKWLSDEWRDSIPAWRAYIGKRNSESERWGWKDPVAHHYLKHILELLDNPALLFIARDPVATALGEYRKMNMDPVDGFLYASSNFNHLRNLFHESEIPFGFISYEKALLYPHALLDLLESFFSLKIGGIMRAEIGRFITPASDRGGYDAIRFAKQQAPREKSAIWTPDAAILASELYEARNRPIRNMRRHLKWKSSRLLLNFDGVLTERFIHRMQRRMEKNAPLIEIAAPAKPGISITGTNAPSASAGNAEPQGWQALTPGVMSLRHRIVRPPALNGTRPVCLFVTYSPDGRFWPHVLRYCKAFREQSIYTIMIAACDRGDCLALDPGPEVCDALIVKENGGFDFACWALALKLFPEIWQSPIIFFANDSVYGPMQTFPDIVRKFLKSDASLIGLTESFEKQQHYQSYFFALKNAKDHSCISDFWSMVKILPRKRDVIREYEVKMTGLFMASGLKAEVLFPGLPIDRRSNPTHHNWRRLVENGFPFVKADLLRDNSTEQDLSGWRDLLKSRGYDPELIRYHLGAVKPDAPALSDHWLRSPTARSALACA
jgi:hypothetical protein